MLLHEVTDLCEKENTLSGNTLISDKPLVNYFNHSRTYVDTKAIGRVGFPTEATYNTKYNNLEQNMSFSDGNDGFKN